MMKIFLAILSAGLILLKAAGSISWPWVWVLLPIWGSVVLMVIVFLCTIAIVHSLNKKRAELFKKL
jgi:hypothetical protein